ncbi:MAG: glycoside hydrolase family 25 protein, partial [Micromonosporaceae bacterium]
TWLDTVEDLTGRTPIIYTGPSFWNDHVGSNAFGRYPLWIAHYTTKPSPIIPVGWTAYTFWQYTSSGRVSGIQGAVVRTRFQGAGADLAAMSNGVPTGLTLTSPESVFAGATATVTGELTTASGGPLGGKTVQVLSRAPGATTWTTLATRTTATDGGYSLHVSPDAATEYSARYAGDTRHLRTTSGVSTVTVRTALATDLTVSAAAERITYGQSTRLTGQLSAAGEGPVVGGTVRVQQRPVRTDTWSPLATATTGDDGTYTLRVTPTRRTPYRATYAGDATRAPADTGLVEVKVARRVSAKLSEDRPRVHTRVNLTGQVTPARPGSAVYRQRWSDGRWKRVATSTLSSTGRYTFTIRPERRAAYTYRVVVPHGEGLAHGVSRTVVMRVQ